MSVVNVYYGVAQLKLLVFFSVAAGAEYSSRVWEGFAADLMLSVSVRSH